MIRKKKKKKKRGAERVGCSKGSVLAGVALRVSKVPGYSTKRKTKRYISCIPYSNIIYIFYPPSHMCGVAVAVTAAGASLRVRATALAGELRPNDGVTAPYVDVIL